MIIRYDSRNNLVIKIELYIRIYFIYVINELKICVARKVYNR